MPRNDPEVGNENPALIRAFYNALQEGVMPHTPAEERQGQHGKRWVLSYRRTLTATQSVFYIYVDNPSTDSGLDVEGAEVYTNGEVHISTYDEPTLDETTFTADEFKNVRSSVTKDPVWNGYSGTDNNVTISDMGRLFAVDQIQSGPQSSLGQPSSAPGYVVDPESSAIFEFDNVSGNDIEIAITIYFHEQVPAPDLTQLEGSN